MGLVRLWKGGLGVLKGSGGSPGQHRLCWRVNAAGRGSHPSWAQDLGRRQEGEVRASLFPPQGVRAKAPAMGQAGQAARAQPGIAAFLGGSEGLGCPGTQGKPSPEPPEPPSLKLPSFVTVCRNNKVSLVGTSCSPAPCSQQGRGGGGGGALPPSSCPQGSSPGCPQPQVPVLPLPAPLPAQRALGEPARRS